MPLTPRARVRIPRCAFVLAAILGLVAVGLGDENPPRTVEAGDKLFEEKNYLEAAKAYEGYLADHGAADPEKAWRASTRRVVALVRLQRFGEAEAAALETPARFAAGSIWQARAERFAGNLLIDLPHHGTRQGGTWQRGVYGQGIHTTRFGKDRAEAVKHLEAARDLYARLDAAKAEGLKREERIAALFDLVDALARFGPYDLSHWQGWYQEEDEADGTVGAAEEEWRRYRVREGARKGVEIDAQGRPVFEPKPEAYAADLTPTRKMKFLLAEAASLDPTDERKLEAESVYRAAMLARARYGPERLARAYQYGYGGHAQAQPGEEKLAKLADDEALTLVGGKLAVLKLPPDEDPLALLATVAGKFPKSGVADEALLATGLYRQSREQFPKALEAYAALEKLHADSRWVPAAKAEAARIRQEEVVLGPTGVQLAGDAALLEPLHRNVDGIAFEARRLDLVRVVRDILAACEADRDDANPWTLQDLSGHLIRNDLYAKYLAGGPAVATFAEKVVRRADHGYTKTKLVTPLRERGAYVVQAKAGRAQAYGFVLLDDLAIVEKDAKGGKLIYVCDARTGRPVQGAKLEVFEVWTTWEPQATRGHHHVARTDTASGRDGTAVVAHRCPETHSCQLVTIARTDDGRVAISGLGWWSRYHPSGTYEGTRAYIVTDRPVYRPGQTVQMKVWVRPMSGGEYRKARAGERVEIKVYDPKGQEIRHATRETDAFGGVDADLVLGAEPPLGLYSIYVGSEHGGTWAAGNQFRVEEYRKPEFEVLVEPSASQVKLGGKLEAVIRARYHFGGPVAEALVSYKVFREPFRFEWFEPGVWDWLYGPGYGLCRYPCQWFGWWARWGWFSGGVPSRELVSAGEGAIGADGTLKVEIDTGPALRDHADTDHRYVVEADVRDASRRTISGEGAVLATRQALYAFVETDRGFYRPGDTVFATVRTLGADGRPARADGAWQLARVLFTGESGDRIVEEPLDPPTAAATGEDGRLAFSVVALASGQYRLTFETKDAFGETVIGTTLIFVYGADLEGRIFKFNDLELVTDKRTYAPGETARVLWRAAHADPTLLFADRVDNGTLVEHRVLELKGRAGVIEVPIAKGDVPNRFIEANLVRLGRLHVETRELLVPPQEGVVAVTVKADKAVYKPGEEGTIEVTTTGPDGAPVEAQVALIAYDKAVLQIQPEMNPDIRTFFWGQKRYHSPRQTTSLGRQMNAMPYGPIHPAYPSYGSVYQLPGYFGGFGDREVDWHAAGVIEEGRESYREGERLGRLDDLASTRAESSLRAGFAMDARTKAGEEADAPASPAPAAGPAGSGGGGRGPGQGQAYQGAKVRSRFADTALFAPAVTTGKDGKGRAKITFPENLTTWRLRAYGMTAGTRVGSATGEVVTTKDLLVRLIAPRFLVERDEVAISAVVMNRLKTEKRARVRLTVPEKLLAMGPGPGSVEVDVPAGGEARVDWKVRALAEGLAAIEVEALTDEESDATRIELPVLVHGAERQVAKVGSLRDAPKGDASKALGAHTTTFTVPAEIRPEASRFAVRVSPSLAGAMLEALPYLLDYPYWCTEQTLNRFVPAVQTARVLREQGIDLEETGKALARLNLNPIDSDHPEKRRRDFGYHRLPVFSRTELDAIVAVGLERLYAMQHGDGGWGWWSNDDSSPYMTALVLDGLLSAQDADIAVRPDAIERGLTYLRAWVDSDLEWLRKHPHQLVTSRVFASYVLARRKRQNDEVVKLIDAHRDHAGAYGLALLALTYHETGNGVRAREILRNVLQHVERDDENETAWVRTEADGWWWWWNDAIETNACALRAVVALDPGSDLAPRLVKWLLANRRNGLYWRSTRDTAAVVDAFADYLGARRELEADMTVTLAWDGGAVRGGVERTFKITRENLFTFDGALLLEGPALKPGEHSLTITREGKGALYWAAYLSYFTLEEDVKASGLEIKVERRYHKLEPVTRETETTGASGQALTEERLRYKKVELESGDRVKTGDLIEVELLLTSKNDYDYLCFEDPKPAGCEPVALRSGARYGELCSNMELRDERVVFFIGWLAKGTHRLTYRVRAEAPGDFHALPARGHAMYAPELRGNADEMRLGIEDAPLPPGK